MAFRFRKQKSLGKFARVNVTKNGVGVSVGPRTGGPRVNISPTGKKSVSASIPGTGLSYSKQLEQHRPAPGSPSVADQWNGLERLFAEIDDAVVLTWRIAWRDDPHALVEALTSNSIEREVAAAFLAEKLGGEVARPEADETLGPDEQWAKLSATWNEIGESGMLDGLRGLWARDPRAVLETFLTDDGLAACDRDTCWRFLCAALGNPIQGEQ